MEPTTTNTASIAPAPAQPVTAHRTLQALPKYAVPVALLLAASLPALLLILTIIVMMSAKYNFLAWME